MSQVLTVDAEQVQFVLNSTDELNTEDLSDILYADGTRAILVNSTGQILQSDTQTVVLQDDEFNQYYINDESGEILVADEQDNSIAQTFEAAEVVQFIEEDSSATAEPQIIYVNEEGYAINDADLSQYQITDADNTQNILSVEDIKLETQVVDLEELLRQQGENQTAIIDDSTDMNGYQYAILKDGKLHLQTYNGGVFPLTATGIVQEQVEDAQFTKQGLDLSRITGKNLLTGQTVTLHGYMDKLQKRLKEEPEKEVETRKRRMSSSTGLKGLLNKKLTLGKTSNGKRLVGKVIHVEKKKMNQEEVVENKKKDVECSDLCSSDMKFESLQLGVVDESRDALGFAETELEPLPDINLAVESTTKLPEKPPTSPSKKKVLVQEKSMSKECFGHVCRTLGGLMNMDSVRKKLLYKNISVKVVEKRHVESPTGGYVRKVSYSNGHMREEFVVNDEGDVLENWTFVSDSDSKEPGFGVGEGENGQEDQEQGQPYPETTNVTLMITQERNGHRAIRVVLNPLGTYRCSACDRGCSSQLQLRAHYVNAHGKSVDGRRAVGTCEVCGLRFDDSAGLLEHRLMHVDEGKLYRCPETECGKFLLTLRKLQRHAVVHDAPRKSLECAVCLQRCSSEAALKKLLMTHVNVKFFSCTMCSKKFTNSGDLNFHRRIHDPFKYYSCDICKRTFSRHSNLQRHVEIHKGSEELYQCTICGCSYHYMSSLTRHVVQNHIKKQDSETETSLTLPEEDFEEA